MPRGVICDVIAFHEGDTLAEDPGDEDARGDIPDGFIVAHAGAGGGMNPVAFVFPRGAVPDNADAIEPEADALKRVRVYQRRGVTDGRAVDDHTALPPQCRLR